MTAYSVSAQSSPGGEAYATAFEQRIRFDATDGRDGVYPGPAELLCASLAACLLKNVERFSHMLPFQYEGARVTVQAERQDSPPRFTRFTYRLEVITQEPPSRVDLLHRNIKKHGTVSGTLALAAELNGELLAVETFYE